MPINQKLMQRLIKEYGKEEGRRIYFAMEEKGHPATEGKGAKRRASKRKRNPISDAMRG